MTADARRSHRRAHHRRYFWVDEPQVVSGEFLGRKLSELSDEELKRFLGNDALRQWQKVASSFLQNTSVYNDRSQYWFAKYELERRKPEAQRDAAASLDIQPEDTKEVIAQKLAEYGFRAASRKFHPDYGGDTATMQKLNAARQLAKERLR